MDLHQRRCALENNHVGSPVSLYQVFNRGQKCLISVPSAPNLCTDCSKLSVVQTANGVMGNSILKLTFEATLNKI